MFAPTLRWLIGLCAALLTGAALAAGGIDAVRVWQPGPLDDNPASARAALAQAPPLSAQDGEWVFNVPPHQVRWYALDLPAGDGATTRVLELTHPSIRSATLYPGSADAAAPVLHGGRDVPPAQRLQARFPATFTLPPDNGAHTVLLRVQGTVPLHGQFRLQDQAGWQRSSAWQQAVMAAGLGVAALGALYALGCAVRLRSAAYGLYSLLALSTGLAAMFITGLGEATVWPALADWRGQLSAALACIASGLALLLSERVFALDVRAPRFSVALRCFGLGVPLAGLAALPLSLVLQQRLSHVAAAVAIVLGLGSLWLAWRTVNRAAAWLLLGFTPVIAGVTLTTAGISGAIPFAPWLLLAMPLGSALELPFNLYGLRLLEQRRARVLKGRAELAERAGSDNATQSQAELLQRLNRPLPPGAALGSVLLLRFEGLAPGSTTLRALDSEAVEHFLHAMMAAAVRPDNHVGRWSFHEIVVRSVHPGGDGELRALLSAMFASALRSERFGIEPREPRLRIACMRLPPVTAMTMASLRTLAAALDDPAHQALRKVEWDTERAQVVTGSAMSRP